MLSAHGVRELRLLQEWVLNWRGMGVTFEIVPVVPSAQTREVVAPRLASSEKKAWAVFVLATWQIAGAHAWGKECQAQTAATAALNPTVDGQAMSVPGPFKVSFGIALFGSIAGCAPNLSDTPKAEEVLSEIARPHIGKQGIANALVDNKALTEHVLGGICSGSTQWISVAEQTFPTNYAHLNEEISSALAVALIAEPDLILEKFGPDICHAPDHLPVACDSSSWDDRVTAALGTTSEALSADRQSCLAGVRPSNTWSTPGG
jgi:hypothetical protein